MTLFSNTNICRCQHYLHLLRLLAFSCMNMLKLNHIQALIGNIQLFNLNIVTKKGIALEMVDMN